MNHKDAARFNHYQTSSSRPINSHFNKNCKMKRNSKFNCIISLSRFLSLSRHDCNRKLRIFLMILFYVTLFLGLLYLSSRILDFYFVFKLSEERKAMFKPNYKKSVCTYIME